MPACSASSSCRSGAPNSALIASPMYLSTYPPRPSITSTIFSKYRFNWPTSSAGRNGSEMEVNPRMSDDSTAMIRFSPCKPRPGLAICWSITDAGTYFWNTLRIRFSLVCEIADTRAYPLTCP